MKKILIITYCTSSNSGTFLQAYGVQSAFKRIYPECCIEFFKASRPEKSVKKKHAYNGIQDFFKINYGRIISFIRNKMYLKWSNKYLKKANVGNMTCWEYDDIVSQDLISSYDLIVTGSDTILDRLYHNNKIGLMWGIKTPTTKHIFFAASGDDCKHLLNLDNIYPIIRKKIIQFPFIGLRDNIIRDFFINYIKIPKEKLIMQPDPTYFLPLSLFRLKKYNIKRLTHFKEKKRALFHFDRTFSYRKELASILRDLGYILVSPEYDPNCDISLGIISPFEWGDLFMYVDIVLTERFHDTIFALRHCKPVINIDWNLNSINNKGQSKRSEILSIYDMSEFNLDLSITFDKEKIKNEISLLLSKFDGNKVNLVNNKLIEDCDKIIEKIKKSIEEESFEDIK